MNFSGTDNFFFAIFCESLRLHDTRAAQSSQDYRSFSVALAPAFTGRGFLFHRLPVAFLFLRFTINHLPSRSSQVAMIGPGK